MKSALALSVYERILEDMANNENSESAFRDAEKVDIEAAFRYASVGELKRCMIIADSIGLTKLHGYLKEMLSDKTP